MAGSDYLDHLASIRLFSSCNRKELAKIAKSTDELQVEAGKVLTEEGRSGHEAFIIIDGEATVEIGGREVARLGPGRQFGELALLDGGPRTATVVAATDMKLLVISQRAFFSLLDEVPGLSRKLLTQMATIIRELDARLPMTH
jgi:CRP-like cAMP-binding protein